MNSFDYTITGGLPINLDDLAFIDDKNLDFLNAYLNNKSGNRNNGFSKGSKRE